MADLTYVRFVDEQRAKVRCLFSFLNQESTQNKAHNKIVEKALVDSVAQAMELALVGFFAEKTQQNYQSVLWRDLLTIGLDYRRLLKRTNTESFVIHYWQEQEALVDSALNIVKQVVHSAVMPKTPSKQAQKDYQSSLLRDTSLVEPSNNKAKNSTRHSTGSSVKNSTVGQVIATSAATTMPVMPTPITPAILQKSWQELDDQIELERAQAAEY